MNTTSKTKPEKKVNHSFAAGALIVEEAGGMVTTVEGGALPCLEKSSVLARNK